MSTYSTISSYITPNLVNKLTTITTAGGTTTLTVASDRFQYFTGTAAQVVTLPVTTTLVPGYTFFITNESTGTITVQTSGANTLVALGTSSRAAVTCVLASGTGTSSWTYSVTNNVVNAGPVVLDSAAVPTYPTAPVSQGVWYGEGTRATTDATSVVIGNGATKILANTNCIVVGNNARAAGLDSTIVGAGASAYAITTTNSTIVGSGAAGSQYNGTNNTIVGKDACRGIEFTASFAGTTMTVSAIANGWIFIGMRVYSSGAGTYVPATAVLQCTVTAYGTGGSGVGTYTVSAPAILGGPFVCVGASSTSSNSHNVALGADALSRAVTTEQVAIGSGALRGNLNGLYNTAVGTSTAGTLGSSNTVIGYNALIGGIVVGSQVVNQSGTTVTAAQPLFIPDDVGTIYNIGGALTPIASYISPTQVTASVSQTITGNPALGFASNSSENVAVGTNSMYIIKSGRNVAVGFESLYGGGDNINTGNCTAVGYKSLRGMGNGGRHTALGYQSGAILGYGSDNVIIGSNSMVSVMHGSSNVVVGTEAQTAALFTVSSIAASVMTVSAVTYGSIYVGMGVYAYADGSNVGLSTPALYATVTSFGTGTGGTGTYGVSIVTGVAGQYIGGQDVPLNGVTAVGYRALRNNGRSGNTAVGYQALTANTSGAGNTAVGYGTGAGLTTGSGNVLVGSNVSTSSTAGNCVAIGPGARVGANDNIMIGRDAGSTLLSADNNIGIGLSSCNALTSGFQNTAIGTNTLKFSTAAFRNIAIGHNVLVGCTGALNTAVGTFAMSLGTGGNTNVAFGYAALQACAGNNNTAIGSNTGNSITTGSDNTSLGAFSLSLVSTGVRNVAIGAQAAGNRTGSRNVCVGYGSGTTGIGVTGDDNTIVGNAAGQILTKGAGNVIIGSGANVDTAVRNNAVVIGNGITSVATPPNPHDGGLYMRHFAAPVVGNTAVFMGNELVETTSSVRFKDNIRSLEETPDKFDKLRPVRYVGKNDYLRAEQIGLIAEEVEPLYPELIVYTELEGKKAPNGIAYERMVAILIREMQAMKAKISELEARVAGGK